MTSFWAQKLLTDEPLPLSIAVQYGFTIYCNYSQGSKLLCKEKVGKQQKSKFFEIIYVFFKITRFLLFFIAFIIEVYAS